jgi:formylglycine-generating enzyme required for sulfatase activity
MKAEETTRSLNAPGVRVPRGVGALFSCRSGQKSFETEELKHGVFFHAVLQGLGGKAINEDGEVTWDLLSAYVKRQVARNAPKYVRGGARQNPTSIGHLETDPVLLVADAPSPVKSGDGPVEKLEKEITNSIGMKLVLVPRGQFTMGSPEDEADRKDDEHSHRVVISKPFYLGAFEVTQAQFKAVMNDNPSYFAPGGAGEDEVKGLKTSDFPVDSVTWEEARDFCEKLSQRGAEKKAGRVYRLPTEAQWEYACRAGAREPTPYHFGASLSASQANHARKPGRTIAVGSLGKPNAWGLHDMHGNVSEWCADRYGADYYRASPPKDPTGPGTGERRVIRGGSWDSPSKDCRSARRLGFDPAVRNVGFGFRVVCLPPAGKP